HGLDVERVVRLENVLVVDVVQGREGVDSCRPDLNTRVDQLIQSIARIRTDQISAHNWDMDRILLEGMSFEGRHGVRPAERERPQEFKVDVEIDCDLSEPGMSDRIEDTVDYR